MVSLKEGSDCGLLGTGMASTCTSPPQIMHSTEQTSWAAVEVPEKKTSQSDDPLQRHRARLPNRGGGKGGGRRRGRGGGKYLPGHTCLGKVGRYLTNRRQRQSQTVAISLGTFRYLR